MIKLGIAGLTVGIDNRYPYLERLCAEYTVEGEPLFTVSVTDEEIEKERRDSGLAASDEYFESIVAYRKIGDRIPAYDAVVFHGAVLNYCGKAFLFTARSGVGKTTHTRLWLKCFGDKVHYLNGDKPVLRFIDGVPYACGTPFKGKERYGINETAPLCGIVFVERGEVNECFSVEPEDAVIKLVTQLYVPKKGLEALSALSIADKLIGNVPFIGLRCNMDDEAARVALAGLLSIQKN
jgi:hypothetical protein